MKMFRTQVNIPNLEPKIDYNSKILFLGSCFSDNIGSQLKTNKFDTLINPFGVIYNPISVSNSLDLLIDNKNFTQNDLSFSNGQWFSFNHHSSFSNTKQELCLDKINCSINKSSAFLKKTNTLFITFGTAWVFNHIAEQRVVSNCHKLAANNFQRERLSVNTIVDIYDKIIPKLKKFNPQLQIIFTVSPIRHWKDGAHENQLSKSTLLLAIDQLQEKYNNINYFPSYEIVMDELRDYRFYADDMIHVSNVGIEYIWTKFKESILSLDSTYMMENIQKIVSACNHRPFNPLSDQHQKFIKSTLNKISLLNIENKSVFFEKEIDILHSQLIEY